MGDVGNFVNSSALADAFFDELTVSASGNLLGFAEVEEDVFDGLFG